MRGGGGIVQGGTHTTNTGTPQRTVCVIVTVTRKCSKNDQEKSNSLDDMGLENENDKDPDKVDSDSNLGDEDTKDDNAQDGGSSFA
jgi:hypothetical protein